MAKAPKIKKGKPIVKWVGGKGRLAPTIDKYMPRDIENFDNLVYVDPFVGAGGMLFYMLQHYPNIKTVIVNDINEEVINCFKVIRDFPEELIEVLRDLDVLYKTMPNEEARKGMFERRKSLYNKKFYSSIERAASFVFLNRTCFNGMHRVNRKGEFNVPFGKYVTPVICDEELIRRDSELLQNVEFHCDDYKHVLNRAIEMQEEGYQVVCYIDPPYRPVSRTACFSKFAKVPFGDTEQEELADMCKRLDYAGVKFLLSNSDGYSVNPEDTFLLELYHKFNISHVMSSRTLNATSTGRGRVPELLVWNYNATKEVD